MDNAAINKARIIYYGFFASLLSFNLTNELYENAVQSLNILSQNPIDEQSDVAFTNMKRRFTKGGFAALKKENNRVFCSPTSSPMPSTASFYSGGQDDGPKRVEMIDYVLKSNYRRNAESYKEHEDHIEFVLLFIQKLITEELNGHAKSRELAKTVFANIYNTMVDEFTDNLFNHEQSFFYKQVALSLRSFTEFERVYLNIEKPDIREKRERARSEVVNEKATSGGCINMCTDQCV